MKLLYKAAIKCGHGRIKTEKKPICRHQSDGFDLSFAEIKAIGKCEIAGETLDFQDVRLFFVERKKS